MQYKFEVPVTQNHIAMGMRDNSYGGFISCAVAEHLPDAWGIEAGEKELKFFMNDKHYSARFSPEMLKYNEQSYAGDTDAEPHTLIVKGIITPTGITTGLCYLDTEQEKYAHVNWDELEQLNMTPTDRKKLRSRKRK